MIQEEIKSRALECFPIKEKENKKGVGTYDPNLPRRKAFCSGAEIASKIVIDKACKWLYNALYDTQDNCDYKVTASFDSVDKEEFIDDFRKAMEE